jgi:hypothetical protein
MDSSIHAHLISQYVQTRLDEAHAGRAARADRAARPRAVRLPRIAWRHSARGLAAAAAVEQK